MDCMHVGVYVCIGGKGINKKGKEGSGAAHPQDKDEKNETTRDDSLFEKLTDTLSQNNTQMLKHTIYIINQPTHTYNHMRRYKHIYTPRSRCHGSRQGICLVFISSPSATTRSEEVHPSSFNNTTTTPPASCTHTHTQVTIYTTYTSA